MINFPFIISRFIRFFFMAQSIKLKGNRIPSKFHRKGSIQFLLRVVCATLFYRQNFPNIYAVLGNGTLKSFVDFPLLMPDKKGNWFLILYCKSPSIQFTARNYVFN